MDADSLQEKIEAYLQEQMPEDARRAFEEELAQNAQLQKELEEYRELFAALEQKHKRQKLESILAEARSEMRQKPQRWLQIDRQNLRILGRKSLPFVAVAACLTLIMVIHSFFTLDNVRSLEEQQSSYYKALRRDLIEVKKEQKVLSEKQKATDKNLEKQQKNAVKSYGATAFVVASNGYLVTNYHVVKNADSIYIEAHRDTSLLRLKVEAVYSDRKKDLSILKITDSSFIGFRELPYIFRNEEADLGEDVFTLAYPRQEMVYGEGSVSARSGYLGDTTAYQISIPVNPGNSGGPLFDEQGNLLGIISGKNVALEGAAFAIKSKYLQEMLDSLSQNTQEQPMVFASKNQTAFLKRPEQIKQLQNFVFVVKVYNSRED